MSASADDHGVWRNTSAPEHSHLDDDQFKAHVTDQLGEIREAMGVIPSAEQIRRAVADGVRDVLQDDKTWEQAGTKLAELTQRQVGGWLVGSIKASLKRMLWAALVVAVIWHYLGWGGVLALFKGGTAP